MRSDFDDRRTMAYSSLSPWISIGPSFWRALSCAVGAERMAGAQHRDAVILADLPARQSVTCRTFDLSAAGTHLPHPRLQHRHRLA